MIWVTRLIGRWHSYSYTLFNGTIGNTPRQQSCSRILITVVVAATKPAMTDSDPFISLWLEGRQLIQLGQRGFDGAHPELKVEMDDTSSPVTLVVPSYETSTRSFNLRHALQCGIFDLFDTESRTKIAVPRKEVEVGELVIKAGVRWKSFDLKLDPQNEFWNELLTPGHKYKISWAHGDNAPWAYRGQVHQDAAERLPVRLGKDPITYEVLDRAAKPLRFHASVAPTDKVCHRSGEPRFGFKLEFTSHNDDILTCNLDKSPLRQLQCLEDIVHVEDEDGQEVEFGLSIGCWEWEGPEPFPSDSMFEEFRPGVPYEKTYWLTNDSGDLGSLEVGKKYRGELSSSLMRVFTENLKGRKEELLAGSEQEKKKRWARSTKTVLLEVSDPFTFKAV
ncbi:hypothetical protein DM02DRAFT_732482 [Periconia macrospinosa]|uniref:Uncharacterized protein n=1 Tax=Periconia macrospinosa TaxID=97972 RepID=A0A2V1DBD8_9PLEO|nr:hypothetical protein DM02DRAFT_732482 [Periconia macrospinosa]